MAKNIIRSARNNRPYTSINNQMLNDRRLSLAARGLLALLISKPPGWEVSVSWVMTEGDVGKEKAYALLKELIDSGYCQRRQLRAGNRQGAVEYILSDSPFELPEKPEAEPELPGSQLPGFQVPEKPDAYKEKISTKERKLENPLYPQGGTSDQTDAVKVKNGRVELGEKLRSYWLDRCGGDGEWLDLTLEQFEPQEHSRTPLESQVSKWLARGLTFKLERDKRYEKRVAATQRDDDDPFAGRRDM
jgi:hypothetical protein